MAGEAIGSDCEVTETMEQLIMRGYQRLGAFLKRGNARSHDQLDIIKRPRHISRNLHEILKMLHRRSTQTTFCRNAKLRRHFLRLLNPRLRPFQVSRVNEAKVQFAAVVAQTRVKVT